MRKNELCMVRKTKHIKVLNIKDKEGGLVKNTFNILKQQWVYLLCAWIITLVVYSFFYGLWKIPLLDFGIGRMSRVTFGDYLFLFTITLLIAILLTIGKFERLTKLKHEGRVLGYGSSTFGGIISAACPVCQGITIAALGSSLFTIPLNFLTPYLGFLKVVSIALLGLAVFFKADSIYLKTCSVVAIKKIKLIKTTKKSFEEPLLFRNNLVFASFVILTILLVFNQFLIPRAFASTVVGSGGSFSLGIFEIGPKTTLKPMPLAQGESPVISGYKTKVKSLPTISELQMTPSTGDPIQDLSNNIIPRGTPWYGAEAGVSFDDPITAQNLWKKGEAIQLDAAQEERWKRIVNSFSCDYCCGSPQRPTIITQCGCAHAAAARGMAKWLIKNYGDKYSDEEIYGEMARWYALWYQQGTIKRILDESSLN